MRLIARERALINQHKKQHTHFMPKALKMIIILMTSIVFPQPCDCKITDLSEKWEKEKTFVGDIDNENGCEWW